LAANQNASKKLVVVRVTEPKGGDSKPLDVGVDIQAGPESARPSERGPAKAVAIKDMSQSGALPRLIASGRGAIAEQILQIAWANDIKVREDADLVEVLAAIDVESDIPIEAFAAVAEILSYVYRANAGEIPLDEPETVSTERQNDVPTRPA
jgi:flagellar biosynthesis protein